MTTTHTATDVYGRTVDLSLATASTMSRASEEVVVRFFNATVDVYTPAPKGGSYCLQATCTHRHPNTDQGRLAENECRERLARIIKTEKRLPNWATLR